MKEQINIIKYLEKAKDDIEDIKKLWEKQDFGQNMASKICQLLGYLEGGIEGCKHILNKEVKKKKNGRRTK